MYLDLNLSALPIFFALWTLIGWLLCYVVAVLTGHIDPLLPLISMCGAQWPESSLFSLFMNMSAVMSAFLSYFRFRQVQHFQSRCSEISKIWKLNATGVILGVLSSVGLLIVANFQEARDPWPQVYLAHVTGALVTFTAGTAVSGLQAWITYLMHPEVVDMWIFWIRIFIAFISTGTYITAIVVGKLAHIERAFNGTDGDRTDFNWDKDSPSYPLDLTLAACEWLVGLAFVAYFLTLYPDFKRLSLRHCFSHTHRSLRTDSDIENSTLISSQITVCRQSSVRSATVNPVAVQNPVSNRSSQEYQQ